MIANFINHDALQIIVAIVCGLTFLVVVLASYCLWLRFLSNRRERKRRMLYAKWENIIFQYLENERSLEDIMDAVARKEYSYFQDYLKKYLMTLKGKDFEKLSAIVTKTNLFSYLVDKLAHGNKESRRAAAFFLGLAKVYQAKENLKQGLNDSDDGVSIKCAFSLARIGDATTINDILAQFRCREAYSKGLVLSMLFEFGTGVCPSLLNQLQEETDVPSIILLVDALGHFRYYFAGKEILHRLDSTSDNELRTHCIEALGRMEYLDALPTLRTCLNDPDWRIRSAAINVLGKIGDDTIENELIENLNDNNWWVRYRAAEALFNLPKRGKEILTSIATHSKNENASSVAQMLLTEKEMWG
ncbi:MAG: HEAT repeat domain-containing protein [Candidatus Methanofastidiosia archaeon]